MNSVVARIQSQIEQRQQPPAPVAPQPVFPNPPIPPEKLREILVKELKPAGPVAPLVQELMRFESIYDFVNWYEQNRDKFSANQQVPLDTLIQTRDMINTGCNCKRQTREAVAFEYFANFWVNNVHTDLMPSLLRAANARRVQFGNFLAFPLTPN